MSSLYTRSRRPIVLDRPHDQHASDLRRDEDHGLIRGVLFAAIPALALWAAIVAIGVWFVELLAL